MWAVRRRWHVPGLTGQTWSITPIHALRQIQVSHEVNIRFVDTHPEGDGCNDDQPSPVQNPLLRGIAFFWGQPSVIRHARQALFLKPLRRPSPRPTVRTDSR